ncbi:MAG: gentisate 1,2-dioxygenase [Alphaproteobacteria bacterium]|nr:MAG: gentisate 1,2-dioxygenase [Alphaproteobacteria bacterium]
MASATATTEGAERNAPNKKQANPKPPGPKHNIEAIRQEYYDRIAKHSMTPLWTVMKNVVTKEPVTRCAPVIWHFDDIKRLVMESGGLITAEEAERRVLILENPAMPGESRATNTLFAGVQMILPGEVAPAHRHVSSAIRFVLDGEGAYTAVEGEKAYMAPGDFVITANWAPHDHGNTSNEPMLWLDVLDFPQVNFFETSFAEEYGAATQPTSRSDGDSVAFYASGVLPDGAPAHMNRSPVINYTYARTRPIIERMMKAGDIDKRHGARARYANPMTGGPVLPTMGACLALFPQGFKGESYRSTEGSVFVCAEGRGNTTVDGKVLEWGPYDVFVVPPWKRYAHTAEKESVLFSISDRPSQEALGIWREDRSPH